jgi:hypothetical protein
MVKRKENEDVVVLLRDWDPAGLQRTNFRDDLGVELRTIRILYGCCKMI